MPYKVDWIVEKRVMFVENSGTLTEEEIKTLSDEIKRMYDEGIAPIHAIEDDREFDGISGASLDLIGSIFEATEAIDFSKTGWAIAIVPQELQAISDFFGKIGEVISEIDYARVQSLPEALDFLSERDATLPQKSEWRVP